jgi:LEA14-like dessication related protein
MRHARSLPAFLSLLFAFGAGGCTSAVFNQPEVTLENVQVGGLGLQGGTLLVSLQVINPNRFSLNADQLTYQLALRDPGVQTDTTWIDFATGTYDQAFSVGARDTALVQIPVDFNYSGLGAAAGSLLRAGTFTYRASGTVNVRTPLGTHEVPYRKRGTFTLLSTR